MESYSSSSERDGWVTWFCDLEGHEFFTQVEESYIVD
jgi:hypothetical protein